MDDQPEEARKSVKTNCQERRSGVERGRAMQIAIVARMLMGANQRMMRWRFLVGKEQTQPNIVRAKRATRTVCQGLLEMR